MAYATRPFEYIHMDFIELPDAVDGNVYVLCITCDFSLTTVLWPTAKNDSEAVVDALLQAWLPYYPDPELLHSDGGTHFDNQVIQLLTQRRGWKHTICTPHAKWANGVAERCVKEMKDIMTQLCRDLDVPQNKWPTILPMVQAAMNRKKRKSRGNRSPIELSLIHI